MRRESAIRQANAAQPLEILISRFVNATDATPACGMGSIVANQPDTLVRKII